MVVVTAAAAVAVAVAIVVVVAVAIVVVVAVAIVVVVAIAIVVVVAVVAGSSSSTKIKIDDNLSFRIGFAGQVPEHVIEILVVGVERHPIDRMFAVVVLAIYRVRLRLCHYCR